MTTKQESAQERAQLFVQEDYGQNLPGLDFLSPLDWEEIENTLRNAFIAGEESGKRVALEELSAKASEGFGLFWSNSWARSTGDADPRDASVEAWDAAREPLLAKIADLESKLQYNREWGEEIEGHARHLSAYQCVHPGALTVREGQDGITCAKQEKITELKEQLSERTDSYERAFTAYCKLKEDYDKIFTAWKRFEILSTEQSEIIRIKKERTTTLETRIEKLREALSVYGDVNSYSRRECECVEPAQLALAADNQAMNTKDEG